MGRLVNGKWSVGRWSVVLIKPQIIVCFALKFIYLKARYYSVSMQQQRYGFLVTVKTIFNIFLCCIIIFGDPYWFSWIIFFVSHSVSNVRVQSFFWSVFFRKIKTLLFVHFSRSVNSNYLPYLPEIEIKLQISLTEINH